MKLASNVSVWAPQATVATIEQAQAQITTGSTLAMDGIAPPFK
jgi:hypothetical protein